MTKHERFEILCNFIGYGNASNDTKLVFILIEEALGKGIKNDSEADGYVYKRRTPFMEYKDWESKDDIGYTTRRIRNISYELLHKDIVSNKTDSFDNDNHFLSQYICTGNLLPLGNPSLSKYNPDNYKFFSDYPDRESYNTAFTFDNILKRIELLVGHFSELRATPTYIFMCKSYLNHSQAALVANKLLGYSTFDISENDYQKYNVSVINKRLIFSYHPRASNKGKFDFSKIAGKIR